MEGSGAETTAVGEGGGYWPSIDPLQGWRVSVLLYCSGASSSSWLVTLSFLLEVGSLDSRSSRGAHSSIVSGREKVLMGELWNTGR